jgi:hypothetical protein
VEIIDNNTEILELQEMNLPKDISDRIDNLKPEQMKAMIKRLLTEKQRYITKDTFYKQIDELLRESNVK